jgi:hypothetical protein
VPNVLQVLCLAYLGFKDLRIDKFRLFDLWNSSKEVLVRHVYGFGKTGFYRPTALLVKPYINLAVTVSNHSFFIKTNIFKYFKAFFLSVLCDFKASYSVLKT